ncbi:MAG: ankyrin repeat domain-containing protein, partial [Rickettsia sp.]|nr:ankyrin repeat domain-containing protein [Rickettsia sp.]
DLGYSPLHEAAIRNFSSIATLLIQAGANIEATNPYSLHTALNYTAENDSPEVTRLLIAAGANLDSQDQYGETSLHNASEKDHLLVAELLVNAGANLYAKDHENLIACDFAQTNEMRNIVCPNINVQDELGNTILHRTIVEDSDTMAISELLYQGADPNIQNNDGNTALHLAALSNDHEVVSVLELFGTLDLNIQNNDGNTALHLAALSNDLEVVSVLRGLGLGTLDLNIQNNEGNTACDLSNSHVIRNHTCPNNSSLMLDFLKKTKNIFIKSL